MYINLMYTVLSAWTNQFYAYTAYYIEISNFEIWDNYFTVFMLDSVPSTVSEVVYK